MKFMNILYGIKNCDSVKKTRGWLESNGVEYQFHDFRRDGLSMEQVQGFIAKGSWETVLNKRSTSWRQLDDMQKKDLNAEKVAGLLLEHPTLIKRPILVADQHFIIGFNQEAYQALL